MRILGLICALSLVLGACAKETRYGDPGRSSDEIALRMTELSKSGSSNPRMARAYQLFLDPNSAVYYAEAPKMGPIHTVFAMAGMQVFEPRLGDSGQGAQSLTGIYIDRLTAEGHQGAFIFDMTFSDKSSAVLVYINEGSVDNLSLGTVENKEFLMDLRGDSSVLSLSSTNVVEDDLAPTVQFWVYLNETLMGKISTMVGHL